MEQIRLGRKGVLIGIGIPGAGKTTHLSEFALDRGVIRLSPDDIRERIIAVQEKSGFIPKGEAPDEVIAESERSANPPEIDPADGAIESEGPTEAEGESDPA